MRDQAFKTVELFVKKLEEHAKAMVRTRSPKCMTISEIYTVAGNCRNRSPSYIFQRTNGRHSTRPRWTRKHSNRSCRCTGGVGHLLSRQTRKLPSTLLQCVFIPYPLVLACCIGPPNLYSRWIYCRNGPTLK